MHDRQVLLDQTRRMLALHAAGTTTMVDDIGIEPVSAYLDPERWERERELLFRRRPSIIGLSCELTGPGAYTTLDIAGVPVVVVRQDGGGIRAFVNACRHRGAQVVDGDGCSRRLTCPYHGWTYDTAGALVGVPTAGAFAELDRTVHGLVELPAAERHGLMFVTATPGEPIDLDALLGPVAAELTELGLDALHFSECRRLEAACNWKLAMDTNCESYHFGALHRNSIGPFTMNDLNVTLPLGRSMRVTFAAVSLSTLADRPEAEWRPEDHLQFVYLLFPNCSLLITGDHVELFRIFPGDRPDRSVTLQSYYSRTPVVTETDQMMATAQFDMFHGVVRDEDYPCAETIQATLATGANTHLTFGRNEPALQHLHRGFDEELEAG